jgi:hypothetical protein
MVSSVALSFEAKSFCMVVLRFATPSCMAGITPVNSVIEWDCSLSMALTLLTWALVLLLCSVQFAILWLHIMTFCFTLSIIGWDKSAVLPSRFGVGKSRDAKSCAFYSGGTIVTSPCTWARTFARLWARA